MTEVDSTSDDRTKNNTVRHQYRVLSDVEKEQMLAIKDKGAELLQLIEDAKGPTMAMISICRELNIAGERVEEAVMWAVKGITK